MIDKALFLVYNIIVPMSERICRRIEVVITGLTRKRMPFLEAHL